jgi:cell division septation protein DedD
VALVPVEKPRETKPATAPAMTKADYYLQLGAYANERQAKDVASGLPSSYPVSVIGPESPARPIFRIVLGPLNKAESGTLLYWFRDRGFPDAFIRTVR